MPPKGAETPIHLINSGPAMAPVAGRHYVATDVGTETAVVADTGGTTYDVSLCGAAAFPGRARPGSARPMSAT